ncbi:hypothetical protein HDV63DRAFT_374822 [Trichoderma sp. SZMC 28014]
MPRHCTWLKSPGSARSGHFIQLQGSLTVFLCLLFTLAEDGISWCYFGESGNQNLPCSWCRGNASLMRQQNSSLAGEYRH